MIRKIQAFAKKAVATTGRNSGSDVETYKALWREVQHEHVSLVQRDHVNLDDPTVLKSSSIPRNLVKMVEILSKEDRGIQMNGITDTSHETLKPCLEFTLEQSVLLDLCAKGLADRPRGMMPLVLKAARAILREVRHPLLPYKAAHQPLCKLIRVSLEVGDDDAQRCLVKLLQAIWEIVRIDNSQLEFFYSPGLEAQEEQLDMFLALLPFLFQHSATGEIARKTMLLVASICDERLLLYIINKTPFCQHLIGALEGSFMALKAAFAESPLDEKELRIAQEEFTRTWKFCNALSVPGVSIGFNLSPDEREVEELFQISTASTAHVSAESNKATEATGQNMSAQDQALPVKGDTTKTDSWEESSETKRTTGEDEGMYGFQLFSTSVVATIREKFLRATVLPALLETSESFCRSAMMCVCTMIETLTDSGMEVLQNPLVWAFVSMLIDPSLEADERDIESCSASDSKIGQDDLLRMSLLCKIDSMSPQLSIAALKIFSALLDLNDPRVLHSLVLRQLMDKLHVNQVVPSALSDSGALAIPQTPPRKGSALPRQQPTKLSNGAEFLERFPGSPRPYDPGSSKKRLSASPGERQNLLSFESYLNDGQSQALAKLVAFRSSMSVAYTQHASPRGRMKARKRLEAQQSIVSKGEDAVLGGSSEPSRFSEGLFLTLVLDKAERILDSSLDENLVLTGILTKLAQSPNEALHAYLFGERITATAFEAAVNGLPLSDLRKVSNGEEMLEPRENIRTLSTVISTVWNEAQQRIDEIGGDFEKMRLAVRQELGVDACEAVEHSMVGPLRFDIATDSFVEASPRLAPPTPPFDVNDIPSSTLRFIQAHIVLEEFLKEIASVIQAKRNVMQLQIELE
mmetsp:Transcript_14499/g.25990  ORF Transcript_14499/g.25990 Transcript_14499/m.25990 type:complete len:863 (-) Transcript_14499:111-2699(-)